MKKKIKVNDKMQKNYSYELTEPVGKNFDKEFKQELTTIQMLKLEIFDEVNMRNCKKKFQK